MGSLYSLFKKKRELIPLVKGVKQEQFEELVRYLAYESKPPDCILVNAQSVAEDMMDSCSTGRFRWLDIPTMTPPFRSMWMEFTFPGDSEDLDRRKYMDRLKYAVQTVREEADGGGHTLTAAVWTDYQGTLFGPCAITHVDLDPLGSIDLNTSYFQAFVQVDDVAKAALLTRKEPSAIQKLQEERWRYVLVTAWHALSRLNCKNVELRPINEGKFRPHHHHKELAASVWHEIVITSVPKVRATGRNIFNERQDESEIRAHWIRGHYADYRKGAGLFGKIHGLFWIPEHRKGNEELGQVIPEYTIQ